MAVELKTPLTRGSLQNLKAGDRVFLSGVIYTGRDAAHQRFVEAIGRGEALPFPLEGTVIFYVGPSPAAPGQVIGAAGPTTSYRMDPYAPELLKRGLLGMIGKGKRNEAVVSAMKEVGAVYFGAVGGAGALLSDCIKEAEVIAYDDLGAEAVRRLRVEKMPLLVIIDSQGHNLYEEGPKRWRQEHQIEE